MNILSPRILPFILAPMLFISGCESADEPAGQVQSDSAAVQVNRTIRDDGILQFNSKNLHKGDKLSIIIPQPHPKELAIKAPDGKWFYLQVENESGSDMLMPAEQFKVLSKLELDTRNFEARYWDDGKPMRGKVFTLTGDYLIYMADNLETEPENTLSFASVIRYTDTVRSN